MTKKIQKIIEEIKLGKRENLYDVNFTLEEYFTNVEGIPFIEFLLKNKIKINYIDASKFKNSIEIAYLYAKYNEYLYNFELSEEDLFSIYNGQRYIDFFAQHDKLTNNIIESIKNNIEIIDILIKADKTYLCSNINSAIVEKIMTKDENGIYPIEKYFNNRRVINVLIPLVNKTNELIEICSKQNKYELLEEANENVLIHKINENSTLMDDLLEKGIIPSKLKSIPKNINFINYLKEKNLYDYLKKATEEVLLLEIEKGKTLLEDVLEKDNITELNTHIYEKKTIAILYSKNRLDLIKDCYDKLLLTKVREILNDKTVSRDMLFIEYMLDKGYNPKEKSYGISDDSIINVFCNKGYYELLNQKLDSRKYLLELDDGTILIDKLLENNCDISFKYGGYEEVEIAQKLLKHNRLDLLVKGKLEILLTKVNESTTYLDYILEAIESKKLKYNLNEISFYGCNVNTIAKFYLTVSKHGMIEYLKDLEEKDLLKEYGGKTLLDELLDLDSELTLNNVISSNVKSKMKIAIIIKARGLDSKTVDVPLEQNHFTNGYLEGVQNTLGIGPLFNEGEVLLQRLFELFSSDGKSDLSLISALISGYRHALLINYETSIQELRNLIDVKEKNIQKFIYVKQEEGAYFSRNKGLVNCDSPVVETLLHETGHALHYYLANNNIPDEYNSIIESCRTNMDTLKKVNSYANKYKELKDKMYFIAQEKYNVFFESYFDSNRKELLDKFLSKSQAEKRSEFETLGLSNAILDIILNNVFTSDEYIKHQKKIFINEYADHIMRSEFGAFMAIGDILDAIYEGELHSGVLKNDTGEKINRTAGHGIVYYSYQGHGFNEIVANFASISKSKDSIEMLTLLRSIVGEQLYNMISEFYYNNIVISNTEKKEETKNL